MPTLLREDLTIAGPAGALEAIVELPAACPTATALICHPHPLHGGTMMNKVVHTLARSFVDLGAAALRFNFRGVGASDGNHDDGVGEVADAVAAAAYLRARWVGRVFYLAGFSFGAAVAVRAAAVIRPDALATVALPFERLEPAVDLPSAPWLLIHGSEDAVVGVDALIDWLNLQTPGPELEVIEGADHFFHGKLTALRSGVAEFFASPAVAAGESL